MAQLIGKVFLQSSTLNLLSSVLDTPEYFWDVPDSHQALYERACEYLELPSRIEVLNARLEVGIKGYMPEHCMIVFLIAGSSRDVGYATEPSEPPTRPED